MPFNIKIFIRCVKANTAIAEKSIGKSAFIHTFKILLFIFLCSLVLNFLIEIGGEERISEFLSSHAMFGPVFAAIVGLIPNCAASVLITQMYLGGILDFGSMISGLLVGAGVGLWFYSVQTKDGKKIFPSLELYGCRCVLGCYCEFTHPLRGCRLPLS